MLVKGEETNKNSHTLQGEIVRNRLDNIQNITTAMADSKRVLNEYETQDSKKQQLREKLYQMQTQLREIEVGIEQDRLKNQNLKNVQNAERELREVRDRQESVLLKSAQ